MTVVSALVLAGSSLIAVAIGSYHGGRRRGRVTLAADLVRELRNHKLHCIGEPPDRVELELALLCDTAEDESRAGTSRARDVSR